ncbi:MAG: cation:proton antiporter [Candidatus Doudnabacteria bacterium]
MNNLFSELTIILIGAGLITFLIRILKQPSIIAYIITGLIIGPLGIYQLHHGEIIQSLSEIGITLLLFMVGLDLDVSQLKRIGKAAVIAGLSQIIMTFVLGFGLSAALGLGIIPSLYIALGLTFSSTIIVVKLLSEKRDLQSLYGKLAVGMLLMQDVAVIFILIFLSGSVADNGNNPWVNFGLGSQIILTIAKAFVIGMVVVWLSKFIFPKLVAKIEKSDEMVLLFALAWSLGLATLFTLPLIGFNAAVGGFVAGLALANSGVHHRVSGRVKPLRDFFVIIFFIFLGSELSFASLGQAILPAVLLSIFVLWIKPIIILFVLGIMGYKPRVGFLSGITLAQISEFSLILAAMGVSVGHLNNTHVTIITLVGIITIAISSYSIESAEKLYHFFQRPLKAFDFHRHNSDHIESEPPKKNHIVIVGTNRLGSHLLEPLAKQKEEVVIIDYDPDVVHDHQQKGYYAICGDITDPYVHELANLEKARLIISTIPDFKDTMAILEYTRSAKKRIQVIVTAEDELEASMLYNAGADYVLLSHYVGSLHLNDIIKANHTVSSLNKLKRAHLKNLHPHEHKH